LAAANASCGVGWLGWRRDPRVGGAGGSGSITTTVTGSGAGGGSIRTASTKGAATVAGVGVLVVAQADKAAQRATRKTTRFIGRGSS
jgi:hypothetical protein